MKRLLFPAALAVGVIVAGTNDARSDCGPGGVNLNLGFHMHWGQQPLPPKECKGPGCRITPGWSGYYEKPKAYGGMNAAGWVFDVSALYPGQIPYCGGYDAVGLMPPGWVPLANGPIAPAAPAQGVRQLEGPQGGRIIENVGPQRIIEKGPQPAGKSLEKRPGGKEIEKAPVPKEIEKSAPEKTIEKAPLPKTIEGGKRP